MVEVEPLTTARALRGPFDYVAPEGAQVGTRLEVPFGRQTLRGIVTKLKEDSEHDLQQPLKTFDPPLPPDLVELALWLAQEYVSTPARALSLMLPPKGQRAKRALYAQPTQQDPAEAKLTERQRALLASLPRFAGPDTAALRRLEQKGLVTLEQRTQRRAPTHLQVGARRTQPPLTPDQDQAVHRITSARPGDELLLHGVTGSGKTEVYLRAAEHTLTAGRGVIVLVPEIGLTPQIVARFTERFGDTVAVLHSGLTPGERYDEWHRLATGEARVCVGPRSAVFAPLDDVGLVVVDEEHDPSYKHEGDPRYDARLVATMRARIGQAVLVAGSATPRPEAVHRLRRIRLPQRVDGKPLPPVEVVDMKEARHALHPQTHQALTDARKAIVLLNRRGWSNFLTCRGCGHAWECPNCDVTLVLHRAQDLMACHHCGHRERTPNACPSCGSVSIARHGTGTERLAEDLASTGSTVFRLDADVADPAQTLKAFGDAPAGVLVGTQMVAKGHDFPDVDLGVVLDADSTLRFPDFRAEERTFALVTQLAGRAGRGSDRGKVLVQTLVPEAGPIRFAAQHDADGFVQQELQRRELLRYPPFSTLIRVVCSSGTTGQAHATASALRQRLNSPNVLGPAPLFRLRNKERSQLLIKSHKREAAIQAVGAAVADVAKQKEHKGTALSVDVDPQ